MDQLNLNVATYGPKDGTPIVLVHGVWHGAWCWERHFTQFFADAGFCVHALDLRGHGESDAARAMRWNRIRHYVDDVEHVVRSCASPPLIIGHSMGGFICQHLMNRDVDLRGVGLLASAPHYGVYKATLKILRRDFVSFLRANLKFSLYPLVDTPEKAQARFLEPDADPALIADLSNRLTDESYMAFWDMLVLNLPKRPKPPAPPVCVVAAECDSLFSQADQEALAQRFGTQARIIQDAPHDVMLSRRWEDAANIFLIWAHGLK